MQDFSLIVYRSGRFVDLGWGWGMMQRRQRNFSRGGLIGGWRLVFGNW